jgi:adenine phosphoribosyltransferase
VAEFNLDDHISKTPGFPKDGITFYDISPALESADILSRLIDVMAEKIAKFQPDIIAAIDARGFLFSLPLAIATQSGAVMVRKAGKLPGEVIEESYALEYGKARLSLQASRAVKGRNVVLCDDLLATGGTLAAAEKLVTRAGGKVTGAICVIELTGLKGRDKLSCEVATLQTYDF